MTPIDRRTAFARHTQWLALVLEGLVVLTLVAGAIPIGIADPVWWLRRSDAAVNSAAMVLLAVILLRLGAILIPSDDDDALRSNRRSFQLATRWGIVFGILVPLQLIGFAWLWADSERQVNDQISRGDSQAAALRSRLMASTSDTDLRRVLAESVPGIVPPAAATSLADQKQQLSEAIAINASRVSSTLRDQHSTMLRSSLPGSLRVLCGAAIASAFLFAVRQRARPEPLIDRRIQTPK